MGNHTKKHIKKRIFVVGCPRSGTTLLQGLLSTHPDVTSFTESHFFDFGIKRPKNLSLYYVSKRAPELVYKFLEENNVTRAVQDKVINRMPECYLINVSQWIKFFTSVLDEIAKARNREIWIEKTPENVRRIEIIEKYTSNTIFIHILRKGTDVVASLIKASREWGRPLTIDTAIKRWNENIYFSYKRFKSNKDIFISYEKLTTLTKETVVKIFKLLNMNYNPAWISEYSKKVETLIVENEIWKKDSAGTIKPRSRFDNIFTEEEKEYIRKNLNWELYKRIRTL